jgi:hypothetical protein
VKITAADAAMRDLDVDVCLLPRLRFELCPFHISFCCRLVEAQPPLKLVISGSHARLMLRYWAVMVILSDVLRVSKKAIRKTEKQWYIYMSTSTPRRPVQLPVKY